MSSPNLSSPNLIPPNDKSGMKVWLAGVLATLNELKAEVKRLEERVKSLEDSRNGG